MVSYFIKTSDQERIQKIQKEGAEETDDAVLHLHGPGSILILTK